MSPIIINSLGGLCTNKGHPSAMMEWNLYIWPSCLERRSRESLARIYYVAPASSPQFSFSIVKLPSESAKFIVTKTLWQGRMWDYYKSFSDKKYIFGSKKILFNIYSGRESTFFFVFPQNFPMEGNVMWVPMKQGGYIGFCTNCFNFSLESWHRPLGLI